ncbi:MAG: hypothetical protein HXS50_03525, partial [Theionarchaea archaeon]|nr:hypothetical protein [Theionarchaea archaeon]
GVACVLFFAVQAVLFSLSVAPTINDAEYADLRQMGEIIPDNSLVIAPRQHGVGYWVEYLVDAKVLGQGEEPSADLWASYDSIFAIIDRKQVQRDGNAVYEGSEMVLVEVGGIDELRDLARIVPIGFG